jgi:hypothetical protein
LSLHYLRNPHRIRESKKSPSYIYKKVVELSTPCSVLRSVRLSRQDRARGG